MSIPIQFRFRTNDVQINSDSNSTSENIGSDSNIPENPWNPIPIPILESELHIIGLHLECEVLRYQVLTGNKNWQLTSVNMV